MDGVLAERARQVAEVRLAPMATRLAHVRGVAAAADRLVESIDPLEADSLVAAAWLHDVGYAPSVRSTGFHSLDGALFVRAEGFLAVWTRGRFDVPGLLCCHRTRRASPVHPDSLKGEQMVVPQLGCILASDCWRTAPLATGTQAPGGATSPLPVHAADRLTRAQTSFSNITGLGPTPPTSNRRSGGERRRLLSSKLSSKSRQRRLPDDEKQL